ncbi:hypothetical protein [Paenimyroides baculatum]|uniref:Uncharacterized protein n=1 Tax=Paenimyroides baculatum TaxID=2608000 RepID=A0A5M6CLF8_9FLAO|nr:hypothetical protein [Paenimyroides baculatum]KAA5533969.1 hypothetical protein F0460_11590 [Paenimyroides baculatum]
MNDNQEELNEFHNLDGISIDNSIKLDGEIITFDGEAITFDEIEEDISSSEKEKLLQSIKSFNEWLVEKDVTKETFQIEDVIITPFQNEDWIMDFDTEENKVSFNPIMRNKVSFEFFEIVILHEFFHLLVQGVPNKDDVTKIKDYFSADFMSLIDIEADFYVALYLKETKFFNNRDYWNLYFENNSKIFNGKWIRNKKIERFIGSMLTIYDLFQNDLISFNLYLPSITSILTDDKLKILLISKNCIYFTERKLDITTFEKIKEMYSNNINEFEDFYIDIEIVSKGILQKGY